MNGFGAIAPILWYKWLGGSQPAVSFELGKLITKLSEQELGYALEVTRYADTAYWYTIKRVHVILAAI